VSFDPITAERAYEIGRAAFPTIPLDETLFLSFVARRAETWGGNPDRAADLYLACACIAQVPAAVSQFMTRFADRVPRYLGRLARNADLVSEVRQILVTRCIVGDAAHPPALNTYSATGSLEGWLRATAVREALALNRRLQENSDDFQAALEARTPWADRELSVFKQLYHEAVSTAFAAACSEIGAEDRALLRLHYVNNVTTANLATLYGISRATLIRRLASARGMLLERVKSALKRGAGVAEQDFDSILKLVRSQVDLHLSQVLKEPAPRDS